MLTRWENGKDTGQNQNKLPHQITLITLEAPLRSLIQDINTVGTQGQQIVFQDQKIHKAKVEGLEPIMELRKWMFCYHHISFTEC